MKTNETPEKIYLEWYREGDKIYRDWCITPKTNNEPVEYTRTDAFIEKASEWLKDNANGYLIERTYHFPYHLDNEFLKDDLVNDFKKAMKGE